MNAYIATAAIPGRAAGSTTRSSAPSGPVPSSSAASSSSTGTASKHPTSSKIENGSENVKQVTTKPNRLPCNRIPVTRPIDA